QVQIRQNAIGLNFIDFYYSTGLYPAPLPLTPGMEGAGVVEALGEGVQGVAVGDRIAYGSMPGAYASMRNIPAASVVKLPDWVSDEEGAAVLLKGLTAWMLLFEIGHASPGDQVLVWAAAGGVGSLLTPWAKTLGCRVIGVVSTEEKADLARDYGCDDVLLANEDVAARVKELTGGRGVDVSYDSVGKSSAEASLNSLRPRGHFITYGNASGPVDPIPPGRLAAGGSLTMTRPTLMHYCAERADLDRGAAALFGAMKAGALKADIRQRFALKDVADAHRALEGRQTLGATVLKP
ncbi:MAG: quinone oxidoreductase, partial [Pseudomonadota bacterium]